MGSYDFYKPIVDLYGPITKNLAVRVVGTYEKGNSYRDVVKSERVFVNPSLLYKFSDRTDLLVQGDFAKSNVTPDAGIGVINSAVTATLPEDAPRSRFINSVWAYNRTTQYSGLGGAQPPLQRPVAAQCHCRRADYPRRWLWRERADGHCHRRHL